MRLSAQPVASSKLCLVDSEGRAGRVGVSTRRVRPTFHRRIYENDTQNDEFFARRNEKSDERTSNIQ